MLVSVQNVTKEFLDDIVLKNVSLDVNDNDRIGLLGVNGAGKTTLLNIITGRLEADSGIVHKAKNLEIGYLRQNDALVSGRTLDEEAKDAFKSIYAVQKKMEECCALLEENSHDTTLLKEYDRLCARFEAMDGYHLDDKINRVLQGLGFGGFDRSTKVGRLSGGEKMRFGIAKMLLRSPELLILDEPTNHLDFSMLRWLEDYLSGYKGAILVVSHDRYFLDAIAQNICEIERTELTRYKGGYTSFIVQKEERRRTALRAYEKQQEEIVHMEEYVRKNLARSSSASSVGSRVKMLEKIERLEKPAPEPKGIQVQFSFDIEPFSTILRCENLGVYVGDKDTGRQLYDGIDVTIRRGEKIALVGLNGVGKSTFLKAIQDKIVHEGRVQWGGNVRLGYFDQELAGLDMESTVLEAVHSRFPTKTVFEIRSALGKMLLEGEAVYKKVKELSGANRAKVAFCILQMQRANVLLLDEPTNHLDYKAKEELEKALQNFAGTLLVVSHDRYFLRQVPSRILELKPQGFDEYNGNYDYYLEKVKEKEEAAALIQKEKQEKPQGSYRSKQQRAEDAQRRVRIGELEQGIAFMEQKIEQLNDALSSPENASDYELLAASSEELQQVTVQLEECMEEWLLLTEE